MAFFLGCLTLEDGTDRLSRNVDKNPLFYTAYSKIPKERTYLFLRGGSLKTAFCAKFPCTIAIAPPVDATRYTEVSSHPSHPQSFIYLHFDHSTGGEVGSTPHDQLAAGFKRD